MFFHRPVNSLKTVENMFPFYDAFSNCFTLLKLSLKMKGSAPRRPGCSPKSCG